MKIEQTQWTHTTGWTPETPGKLAGAANLVLVFGSTERLKNAHQMAEIRNTYPNALISGCSTAGEIFDITVSDDSLSVTAIHFEHTRLQTTYARVSGPEDSFCCGKELAQAVPHEGLRHVFILSDGLNVNGSELVAGLSEQLPKGTTITGGLSGDADRFEETLVLWKGQAQSHIVTLIGLYGAELNIGFGSLGGWDSFGPERLITRANGNVLYEMDGKSALELYKSYLGEHANGLPATGLLFPLSLRSADSNTGLVRTILAVDEDEQSMTFAGDMPEGSYARLMKANFNRLVDGAVAAAETSAQAIRGSTAELAILISCVGRKMVLKQRTEEEVEGVREVFGPTPALTGFYSYGEISPFIPGAKCELHNQTMTITTFSETSN
ncbi:MAG TPA: hypothetical protein ENK04_11375 [Gammaproteobacteria bacterium]|nr:hypothetical protein [Gammaproteobacteria bacterium]